MARNKGKRGERAVIDWLQPIVDKLCLELGIRKVILQRNTVQSDQGGSDIIGLDWMSAEVKNCEAQGPAALASWWEQTEQQARDWPKANGALRVPVLFYTRNHNPIRVRTQGIIFAQDDKESFTYCMIDVSAESFEAYFWQRTKKELQSRRKPLPQDERGWHPDDEGHG